MSSTGNTRVSFYTTDGVLFYIFTAVGTADNENTSVYIDLNGAKAPNTLGKDLFFFLRINGRGIYPLGYNVSHDNVNENCSTTCTSAECGKYCAAKIMQDGWEIKY